MGGCGDRPIGAKFREGGWAVASAASAENEAAKRVSLACRWERNEQFLAALDHPGEGGGQGVGSPDHPAWVAGRPDSGGLLDDKCALHVGVVFAMKWVCARRGGCGECRCAAAA